MAAAHWLPKSASEDYGPSARKQVQQRSLGGGGSGCRDHLGMLCFAAVCNHFPACSPEFLESRKTRNSLEQWNSRKVLLYESVVPRQLAVYFEFRKPVLVQYTFS